MPDAVELRNTRVPECTHGAGLGCYHCCTACDLNRHTCPGCSASVPHGTTACAACSPAAIPQTSPLAAPAPSTVELDETAVAWHNAIREADQQIATWTGIRGRAIEHVQSAMGAAVQATIGGRPAITWAPSKPSMRLDRKALEAAYGTDVIATFLRESKPARPFRLITPDGE